MQNFGRNSRLPKFITLSSGRNTAAFDIVQAATKHNWFTKYFIKSFPLVQKEEIQLINDFYGQLLEYLDSNKIKNSSHLVPKGKTLSEGIFLLSYNVKADLIAIMNLQDDSILGLLENSFQDEIIGNDYKIPVLCVNPHVVTKASGSVFVR